MPASVVCAWCQCVLASSDEPQPISHGMCLSCVKSTDALAFEELGEFSQTELDKLPLGVIELDRAGYVRSFNQREVEYSGLSRESVLGQHFFTDVAPCTRVAEFFGRFERLVGEPKPKRENLDFVFAFKGGERMASITMNWDPRRERVTLLIEVVD